jgi:DNA-binding MarR family transcriptional regulator
VRLHTRREKRGHRPGAQGHAVMQHLALSGPLTVGEAARHFERAQSVVSELVDRLAADGFVSTSSSAIARCCRASWCRRRWNG